MPADTGAKIRTYNLLKNAAKDNRVSLLSFYQRLEQEDAQGRPFGQEENDKAVNDLKKLGIETYLVKTNDKIRLSRILGKLPVSIEKYSSEKMKCKLKELLNNEKFDLIHFDHLHMGQYRECVNGLPCVLDEHNVESVILKRCAERERGFLKRLLFKSQAKKMVKFEAGLADKFTQCLVVSESDKQKLHELSGRRANISVISNGVDTECFKPILRDSPLQGQSLEETLVFTGSMDWLPNSDAVLYFCKSILPLVWQKNKSVKFYIVGKNPTAQVKELGKKDARIIVTGSVEDVKPYMVQAGVFVCPLRIGGGTRLKILEAMAMEKTVVSTTLGAEGITYTPDKDIIIKDKPREFADCVLSLLKDKTKRDAIGAAGRALVCSNYDWKIIAKKLTDVYKELINEK